MAMEKIDAASLPQNIEAEQALLGALLSNNKAFEQVSDFLKPAHFARRGQRQNLRGHFQADFPRTRGRHHYAEKLFRAGRRVK